MTKSYLVSFTSSMGDEKVKNLLLVHADSFEEAVEKIKKRREYVGMPLDEDDQFTNATME